MQPGFDLRIRSMIKALSETVLPAVDPANKAAIEQLHITLGSLSLLGEQIDHAYAFEIADLRDTAGMIEGLAEHAGPVSDAAVQAAAWAEALAAGKPVSLTRLQDANNALREAIAAEIEAAYQRLDPASADRLDAWLLRNAARQIGRERAFVAGTGFDVFPDTLKPIGAILGD